MSVIATLEVNATTFELGRVLRPSDPEGTVELESLVPLGDRAVPLFWIRRCDPDRFEAEVEKNGTVVEVVAVDRLEDRTLFALQFRPEDDELITGFREHSVTVLNAQGSDREWRFDVRFESHDDLLEFEQHCSRVGIELDPIRLYHSSQRDDTDTYGLSEKQREALTLAIRRGYYDIPRRTSTMDLADELGISDQAVTERLRRGIVSLTEHTVLATDDGSGTE